MWKFEYAKGEIYIAPTSTNILLNHPKCQTQIIGIY